MQYLALVPYFMLLAGARLSYVGMLPVMKGWVCFPVAVPIYSYTKDVAMMGISHILFWTPLLICLSLEAAEDSAFRLLSLYEVWTVLLMLIITISVAFDVRAVFDYVLRRRQD